MKKNERAILAVEALEKEYPDGVCSLDSKNALELLIATRLSAQCTDARVNIVTKELFQKYRNVQDYADANIKDIETIIHSCGLYKTKARDIINMCRMLLTDFAGEVPDTIEQLTKLPGVGRKTANLIVGDVFGKPSIVVDTHCIRITNRLGLVDTKDPYKAEISLRKIIPPEKSGLFCHRLVLHGRAVCKARNPECGRCRMQSFCKYANSASKPKKA